MKIFKSTINSSIEAVIGAYVEIFFKSTSVQLFFSLVKNPLFYISYRADNFKQLTTHKMGMRPLVIALTIISLSLFPEALLQFD